MRYVFIVNPAAGKKNPEDTVMKSVRAYMKEKGIAYTVHMTQFPGHGKQLAEAEIAGELPVRLYAVGGDGTFRELAEAAAGHPSVEVGVIPCGSGDDYIRNFADREAFLDMEKQLAGESQAVDIMETEEGLTVNVGCVGLDGKVAYHMTKYKRIPFLPHGAAYNMALLQSLLGRLGNRLEVWIDGKKKLEGSFVFALAANGGWYGGGYHASPRACVDDGLLELTLVRVPKIWKIPKMVNLYKQGKHLDAPEFRGLLEYCRGKEFLVTAKKTMFATFDGECVKTKRMHCRILPGALRFIVPKTN